MGFYPHGELFGCAIAFHEANDVLEQVYKQAQQELGITDSCPGRKDAAYAAIFELIFKFAPARSELRPLSRRNFKGEIRCPSAILFIRWRR